MGAYIHSGTMDNPNQYSGFSDDAEQLLNRLTS